MDNTYSAKLAVSEDLIKDLKKYLSLKQRARTTSTPSKLATMASKAVSRLAQLDGHQQRPVTVSDLQKFWNCDYSVALYRAKEGMTYGLIGHVGNASERAHLKLVRVYGIASPKENPHARKLQDLATRILVTYGIHVE